MNDIYVTSDLHLSHNKPFLYNPRGFNNILDMNRTIVENWNEIIDDEDDIYLLGDVMLSDINQAMYYFNQLRGRIHLIRGNHDGKSKIELLESAHNVVEIVDAKYLKYRKYHFFLNHYPCLCANKDDDKPLTACLISLCGHSHYRNPFRDMDKGLIYHCELDCNSIQPILIDKIIENLKWFSTLSIEKKKQIISMEAYNEK